MASKHSYFMRKLSEIISSNSIEDVNLFIIEAESELSKEEVCVDIKLAKIVCEAYDFSAKLHCDNRQFITAGSLVMKAIELFVRSGVYEIDDVAILHEKVKAAGVYLCGGDTARALKLAVDAEAGLRDVVSSDDIDLVEARAIIDRLRC